MRKFISFLILISLFIGESHAVSFMKPPSLNIQMKRQEWVNKVARVIERKIANQMKLIELQARKKSAQWWNTGINSTKYVPPDGSPNYTNSNPNNIANIDMSRIRSAWFGWYNGYRSSLNLGDYGYDSRLDSTAHDWNISFSAGKWQNHHRRNSTDSYYDFPVIDNWFLARGINPKVINRSKHTENVGYGYYNCSSNDCTDKLITSIRSTFDFFMSEKGKPYDAHYRSIINPHFTKMGFDIIVVPSEGRYYITVHYITE